MKKTILLTALIAVLSAKSQSSQYHSFVTKNKDTLFILKDDLGVLIKKVWDEHYDPIRDGKKPQIIFVDVYYIKNRHKNQIKTPKVKTIKIEN